MDIEEHVRLIETRLESVERRLASMDTQLGRLTSHIESEVALARRDVSRIETRLFGKDDDDIFGGRIGQLTKGQARGEKVLAYGGGFVAAIMLIIEFFK